MNKATFKIGQVTFEVEGDSGGALLNNLNVLATAAPQVFEQIAAVNQANMAVAVTTARTSEQTPQVPVQPAQQPPAQPQQQPVYQQPAPQGQQMYQPQPQQQVQQQYAPNGYAQPQAGPPVQQQNQYGVPQCPHGPLKDLLGQTNQAGGPYKFRYYCAADRNDPTKCNPAGRNA